MPSRIADAQFSYTFDNWDKTLAPLFADAVYTAVYKKDVNQYKVTFYDEDGTSVLDEHLENYGATPTFSKSAPIKASSTQYDYTFKGWDRTLEKVVGPSSYKAQYSSKVRQYKVTFLDEGGAELQSSSWDYGATPVYSGNTPTKSGDKRYTYTFNDWDKTIGPVTGDTTYTAKYQSVTNQYTVSFVDSNGQVLQASTYDYGTMPSYTGTVTPSKAKTAEFSYAFNTWSPALSTVIGDVTYTASFTSSVNTYTVRFLNEDGTELSKQTLPYGTEVTYQGTTPTKTADVQYTYTFKDWDKTLAKVTGDATYTATFANTTNQYKVTFVNSDGTVLQSSSWDYGATPTFTAKEPLKNPDGTNAYIFNGWNKTIGTVTGDVTYTATFKPYSYTLKYTYDSSTTSYAVSGYSGYFHDIVIPETYNDGTNGEHDVTALNSYVFQNSTTLSRVKILARLTSFGTKAFAYDSALFDVSLPEGLALLDGDAVFAGSSLVTSLNLPSTVATISSNFFQSSYLTSITIPQAVTSIGSNAFQDCRNLETAAFAGVPQITTLGERAFLNCKAFKKIDFPKSISAFGYGTFEGCSVLDEVTFESGFTSLNGDVVFRNCTSLKSVAIPSTVTVISDGFFAETGITSLTIPATLITIGSYTFHKDLALTSVTVEDGSILETMGEAAFADCTALNSFVFAGSAAKLTNIGKNTFMNDTALTTLTMAGSNAIKLDSPLYKAGKLEHVSLPEDWTSIPESFFAGSTIESYVIPRTITKIGASAFDSCKSLKSISFESGSSLSEIGDYAFSGCTSLTSIPLPQTVMKIDSNAFNGCTALTSFKMPVLTTYLGDSAFINCTGLTMVDFTGCGKITAYNTPFKGCTAFTSVSIPSSMTVIGKELFETSCLTSISIPNTVTEIENGAFNYCKSLASVSFASGSTLTKIDDSAFQNDTALTNIKIPASVTRIESYAFAGCTALATVDFSGCNAIYGDTYLFDGDTAFTSVTIPASMTEIGSYLFCRSSLTSVLIPVTVTKIDNNAFDYCEALTDFRYAGTVAQWNAITKGSDWHIQAGFTTVTCTDGVVTL